jgi:hypothetical protein
VLPRCDVVLPDGVYTWATVVVENGCIVDVQQGQGPLYQPDICCPTGTGGGGSDGLDGPPGPPGPGATVNVGAVQSLPSGAAPTVVNTGTPTNAILNFGIPRGEDGVDAGAGSGLSINTIGIEFVNGLLQTVPVQWPPVMQVLANPVSTIGVTLTAAEDPATGIVTLTLDMTGFVTDLTNSFQAQLDTINTQMSALQTQLISLQEAVLVCCPGTVLDINGDGSPNPGGTPGVSPPPPVDPN